ncbi:hypothetical protein SDRG_00984 [Saprolegnia diclina VS20]|uniref:DUSP domain-containing protein n=1 Tax=Saprolegnia diclina (strain VS20) TaxID=1156394 RepID=T0QVA7_SAPDV|nr:hypothetical protein SDRG_00984 [Saprolegnia diclina VS20]EQC42144.1 hypothetical protein SDRG_00984 [Saprolegnia diclina VS20]|eukprot:XP_008604713.1 hypothetical protein SDRG_00984 [Saprolegnia diclina VS20]
MMEPQRRRHSVDMEQDREDMEIEMAELGLSGAPNQHSTGVRVDMELRRRLERDLVLKHDSTTLKYKEAWFFIETSWMEMWMNFVLHDGPLPGPISNQSFYTTANDFRKDLHVTKHYRCVNPRVYAIYAELYGTGGAVPIARYTLDLYATPILRDDVIEILKLPELSARVAVSEMREKYEEWPEDEPESESWWYRCCCRCDRLPTVLGRLFGGPTYAVVSTDDKKKKKKKKGKKKGKKRNKDEGTDSDSSDTETEETGLLAARDED